MPVIIISIDGPDFSGKSTIANLLIEELRKDNKGIIFKRTEIPSALSTGFFTKILRNSSDHVSSNVFALAYATDHLHHYETVIKPLKNSKENFVVIQERSLLSTYIYQSIIGNTDSNWVRNLNKFDENMPDLTLVLKVADSEIYKRGQVEKREFDKFETREHLEKELKVYYNIPKELAEEFNVEYLDASGSPEEVVDRCVRIIQKAIDEKFK